MLSATRDTGELSSRLISDAVISGSLGRALYRDSDGLWTLDHPAAEPRAANPNDVMAFRHIAREVDFVDPSGFPVQESRLRQRLQDEVSFFQGLDGLLVGMDPEFRKGSRSAAIREAQFVLSGQAALIQRVRKRILIPLNSQEWDPKGGLMAARDFGADVAADTYVPLADGTVDRIADEISELVLAHFGGGVEAERARAGVLGSGVVAELAMAYSQGDRGGLSGLPFRIREFPELFKIDPNGKILAGLLNRLLKSLGGSILVAFVDAESEAEAETETELTDPLAGAVLEAMNTHMRRKGKSRGYDLTAIQREIGWISDRLRKGEVGRAEVALRELIEEQAKRSRPQDLIKTLTSVADNARRARLPGFALRVLDLIPLMEVSDALAMSVRGEVLRDLGRTEEALLTFQETMKLFPENDLAFTVYAETLHEVGRTDDALKVLEDIVVRPQRNGMVRNLYAEILRENGRIDEALAILKDTVEMFPEEENARNTYAVALLEVGRIDEALDELQAVMEHFSHNGVAATIYGQALMKLGRTDEALAALWEAMEQFPEDEVQRNAYAEGLREVGRVEEALAVAQATMNRFPSDTFAPNIYAKALRQLDRKDEALLVFERAMERFPRDRVTRNGYAETLSELGWTDKALEIFQATMSEFPNDEVAYVASATLLLERGQIEETITSLQHEVIRFPNKSAIRNIYAEALRSAGRLAEAISVLEATIERFPNDEFARNIYADALLETGQTEKSFSIFQETIIRLPNSSVASCAYAQALREVGNTTEALHVLDDVINRFPRDVVARNTYAEVLRARGHIDDAIAMLSETLHRFPGEAWTRISLANLFMVKGEYRSGDELIAESIDRLRSRSDWIALHISGMAHLRRRLADRAIEIFEKGRKECPFPHVRRYFDTAFVVALLMGKRPKQAVEEILSQDEAAPSLRADSVDHNLVKAHALAESGDRDGTKRIIAQVQGQQGLNENQRALSAMIWRTYVTHASEPIEGLDMEAANDNIFGLELELLLKVARPPLRLLDLAA